MEKLEFFNTCDRWRIKFKHGEDNWQIMMANKEPISKGALEMIIDLSGIMDEEDETLDDFIANDPDSSFYRSNIEGVKVAFFQTAGFEFIFTEDGLDPHVLKDLACLPQHPDNGCSY